MQSLEECDVKKRINAEIRYCFTFEEEKKWTCAGASGRKLRQVCIYCPNFRKGEGKDDEKGD